MSYESESESESKGVSERPRLPDGQGMSNAELRMSIGV
jgi:hypothetical protein